MNRVRRFFMQRRDPVAYVRSLGVHVGSDCKFVDIRSQRFGSEPWLIHIGDHVEFAPEVRVLTHDGAVWVLRGEFPRIQVVAPVTIGNNVFVGTRATLLPGVTVGNDAVIAACAVVRRDVEPGTIVAGNPAVPIGTVADFRERILPKATFDR